MKHYINFENELKQMTSLLCFRSSSQPDGSLRNKFNARSNSLVHLAVDKINFDLEQLKEIMTIKNDPEVCKRILPRAKATVIYLLKNSYEDFIKYLLDSRLSIATS